MMEITLEGVAGRRFGRKHRLAVRNPNEAIRALCQLIPGFRSFLTSAHEYGIYFQMLTNHTDDGISYEDLGLGCSSMVLVPVITGAGFSFRNILTILVGVALVAFSMGAFGVAFGAAGTISAGIQTALMSLGFALIFTGIAGLFAPGTPQEGKSEGAEANDAVFGGGASTAGAGNPIPLLYGTFLTQSMPVISSYIEDNDGYLMTVISEGTIEGLPNGASRDLYFNGLQSGSTSVRDIQITDGSQTSQQISIVKSAGFHMPISSSLALGEGSIPNAQIVRSFAQQYADILKVRIVRGPCYSVRTKSPKSGGGSSVSYHSYTKKWDDTQADNPLEYNLRISDGDGNEVFNQTFVDDYLKSSKVRVHEINISNRPIPISIQVTRLDRDLAPDPESEEGGENVYNYQWVKGDIQVVSADVMWSERLVYPGSALMAMKFSAGEFSQMPSVQGLFKGIKIPHLNSSLEVFYAWGDNPAYVLLDLLTHPRYGLGARTFTLTGPGGTEFVQPGIRMEDIDLASFKAAARFCNEKGYKFNAYIDRNADALDLVRAVASSFNAMLVYAGGFITLVLDKEFDVDADVDDLRLFSEANVLQETDDSGEVQTPCFAYEGTGRQARTTAVQVGYINSNEFYTEDKVVVEDIAAIERYGYNLARIRALGCTDRSQAERVGRYTLGSNLYSTETVTFKVASEGAMLLPGDICLIADPLKTRITCGGRINSASSNSIITDRDLSATTGSLLYLYTYGGSGLCQRNPVSSISGSRVTISGSFTSTPSSSQMWVIVDEANENKFRRYRVQSVKENANGTYEVVGLLYSDKKFDMINGASYVPMSQTRSFYKSRNPAINPSKITFSLRDAANP